MNLSGLTRAACVAAALPCLAPPQTRALEIGGASPARLDVRTISQADYRGGAVYRGGVYRGPQGGVYRGGTVYRDGVYRGGGYGYRGYGYRGYGYRPGYAYRPGYWGG